MTTNQIDTVQKNCGNLPDELKSLKCFALRDIQASDGKAEEIFRNPVTNKLINANNYTSPDSYENLDDVKRHLSDALPDTQLAVRPTNGICVIRMDQCLNEKNEMDKEAGRIVDKMDSYTEKTPDGAGLTILFKTANMQFDDNLYDVSNPDIGLEAYIEGHTEKCVTVSGETLTPGLGIEERSERFQEVMDKYLKKAKPAPVPVLAPAPNLQPAMICKSCMDDYELVLKAKGAKNGDKFKALMDGDASAYSGDADKAVSALLCSLAFWSKDAAQIDRIFRTSKLMFPDWDKPSQNNPNITVGEAAIQAAINFTQKTYSPKKKSGRNANELIVHSENGDTTLSSFRPERSIKRNDIGISKLFADVYKKECRYVTERKKWYVFTGKAWKENDVGAMERAKEFAAALLQYACLLPDSTEAEEELRKKFIEYAQGLQKRKARETILKDACSVYPISMNEFDRDPYMLNCLNGTLDLRTYTLSPHNPDDLLTKLSGVYYDSQAVCPRWEKHMDEVTEGDTELKKYMQKAFGYGLTGDTRYECFFILFGPKSRNGKGTTMETMMQFLGDYGRSAMPDTLAQKLTPNGSGPSEDIARLAGARLVNISEPDQKMVLSTSLVKTLTGNDTVTARFLHENSFEYKPTYKLFINTNYLPKASDITIFRSGRVKVVPFNHCFSDDQQDKCLKKQLAEPENLSGILNWCIEGLRLLESEGFGEPDAVQDAVAKYAKDSDKVARFMEEYMEENPYGEILTDEAYQVYEDWCKSNGQLAGSASTLKQSLESHGVTVKKTRPRDKSLGTNPRSMIQGYSWQSGRRPAILPSKQERR